MSRKQPIQRRQRQETEEFVQPTEQSYQVDAHKQRVAQTDMVYLIGLPEQLAHEELLAQYEYCGQYGSITKVLVKENHYSEFRSYCAYISYELEQSAALAVLALNNLTFYDSRIYASYGTNKYCSAYIRYGRCRKQECPFLHCIDQSKEIHETDNRKLFQEQQRQALRYLQQHQHQIDFGGISAHVVFPSPREIKQRLVDQGALSPANPSERQPTNKPIRTSSISEDKKNLRSEASTECSPSREVLLEDEDINEGALTRRDPNIPNLIIRKVSKVKKSLFGFASGSDAAESDQTEKDLRYYLLRSQLQQV